VSDEFTVTHPGSHPTQRNTTSTPYLEHSTAAGVDFTGIDNVSNSNYSSDFPKSNETLAAINASGTAKAVSVADSQLANHVTLSEQVLDHVTPPTNPTSDSPGHVTKTSNDSARTIYYSTETGNGSVANDDVIVTSPQSVPGNNSVSENTQVTSPVLLA